MYDNLRVEFVRKDGSTWDYNWGEYVSYELLGIYPELTEEQIATIGLDLESFQSLMEREKCYTVNPYGKMPEYETQNILEYFKYRKELYKWQEAQQTTFDKYAILIKSK